MHSILKRMLFTISFWQTINFRHNTGFRGGTVYGGGNLICHHTAVCSCRCARNTPGKKAHRSAALPTQTLGRTMFVFRLVSKVSNYQRQENGVGKERHK